MSKAKSGVAVPGPRPRAAIAAMQGYTPGEQPPRGARVTKLNTNENPYPPSPRVMEIFRNAQADDLRRYPDPLANAFRQAIARRHGLSPEQVIAGNGSDDILNLVVRAYLEPGDGLAYPAPTYSLYPVLAGLQAARVVAVPWETGWALPARALLESEARVIFVVNPNAPSGTLVAPAALSDLASRFPGLVLIDEAYVEFADADCLDLLRSHENVIVCRTLSKSYALAGLRFGYGMAAPGVIAELMKVKDSYNCDALSIAAATAAIEDEGYARELWRKVRDERARLAGLLCARGWDVIPSQTNFLFARPPGGNAGDVYRALKARGVLVRFFSEPGIDDRLRITVGTPADTDALLGALD